jgi:dihydrolipoamide dehydrogenase
MSLVELNVPDIGDVSEVDVIEVLVSAGDVIQKEQSLITVESDKASMEIPAERSGTVKEVLVKVGDKVSKGSAIVRIDAEASGQPAKAAQPPAEPAASEPAKPEAAKQAEKQVAKPAAPARADTPNPASASAPSRPASAAPGDYDVLVLGAGPGGYSAAFRAADLGLSVVLVERYDTLGGVCLNVGCIPSKALLHSVAVLEEAKSLAAHGIQFGEPRIDLDALRSHKNSVVGKLTTGLAGMAKARKVTVMQGEGVFSGPNTLTVTTSSGDTSTVRFSSAVIAAGSQSVKLPFLPKDPRVVDSTGALELAALPQKMLIVGGGIIGLEMGTVYSALGARLDVVEMQTGLMPGADRDVVKVWEKKNAHRFDRIMLETRTVSAQAKDDGIWVSFEGKNAPSEPQRYDLVLQAVGRRPNGKLIGADKAGVTVSDTGFIQVDAQMRTNVPHIYAIGDIVGQPMLAHKAVHEGHVAAEVIAGEKSYFDAQVIPSVAYTDPEVAWVGLTEEQAKAQGVDVTKGVFPWAASGRAIANGRDEGFTKLLFDAQTHRIVGGAIVGTGAGDLISEVVLAIEMGADAVDIGKTIHPHPTLGESVGMAAEVAEGSCTDLPPARKRR